MGQIFVNFSNHPYEKWSVQQQQEAQQYGEVIDIAFPEVPAEAREDVIQKMAEEYLCKILQYHPVAVMCQGEFTLSYLLIQKLKKEKITVVAACSKRNTIEQGDKKITQFQFVQFREYES